MRQIGQSITPKERDDAIFFRNLSPTQHMDAYMYRIGFDLMWHRISNGSYLAAYERESDPENLKIDKVQLHLRRSLGDSSKYESPLLHVLITDPNAEGLGLIYASSAKLRVGLKEPMQRLLPLKNDGLGLYPIKLHQMLD